MMTATSELTTASALTASWVRAFVASMANNARAEQSHRSWSTADSELSADIAASVCGDGEAYARIIRHFQAAIARRMTRFTRDRSAVEELVHDVFVEAYFSLPRYRGDAPLEHWLQRIATRVGYRYWKRSRGTPTVSLQMQVHDRPARNTSAANDDVGDDIAAVLEQLPPRDRLVLTLLYLESRSVAEAAELAGWSQTMVKVQAYRARKKFHKLFNEVRVSAPPRSTNNE